MGLRGGLARDVLNVPPDKVRVLTGNVGGSFGMKSQVYPEYGPLLLARKTLGRPVKWTDERSESFLSDHHGRDHQRIAELALDKDGRFLAVRLTGTGNAGAYIYPPMPATTNAVKNVIDVYRTPAMEVNSKVVFTNTTPIGAYRGAGRPEGNYYMERLIDTAAREMGIDRVELRRRNHIAPEQMPYKAPSGMNYDSGEFTTVLDKALVAADWQGFDKRKAESKARNKLRGRGIGSYLEVTGAAGQGVWRHPLRGRRHGHHAERHARLRPGPRHALRPGADRQARHPVRALPPAAGRLRPAQGGRRHRRLEIGAGRQPGVPRGRRQADRAGQADRRARARGLGRRHRVRRAAASRSPAPTAASASSSWPTGCARASACRPTCRSRSTSATSRTTRRSRSPTAATSPRSRSTATPGRSRWCATSWSTTSARSSIRCWSTGQAHGGVMQGIGQALMERTRLRPAGPAAHRLLHGLRPAARLRTRRTSSVQNHSGAVQDQPAGRQGLRRGGLRRRAALGDERRGRCAVGAAASRTSTCR